MKRVLIWMVRLVVRVIVNLVYLAGFGVVLALLLMTLYSLWC